jgi:hypothetical protein
MRKAAFVFAGLFLAVCCQGRTITVDDDGPADYNNIQAAIDAAVDGDTVSVADGTYTSRYGPGFDFHGKAITVISENGPESCVIDGQDFARGFYFHNGEDSNSVLDGFTITNGGWPYEYGGGIYCQASSPTIRNCIISNNTAPRAGGILCLDSSPVIANCIITANHATAMSGNGGGILCWRSSPIIANSRISGNWATWLGGAIYSYEYSSPTITNCTVTGNSATAGGAIHCYESNAAVTNCILWDNFGDVGSQINLASLHSDRPCTLSLNYSDLQGGQSDVSIGNWSTLNWGPGNIDADPRFVEPGYWDHNGTPDYIWDDFWVEGDYHLLSGSPCIDAGDPNYIPEPNETDLDGNPRLIGDGIDMGAYEYVPPIEAAMQLTPQTINCNSKGKLVKAHITLPQGFLPDDVNVNTPAVAEPMHIESQYIRVFASGKGLISVEIAFDRPTFCEALSDMDTGSLKVTVTGELLDGTPFEGRDTIRVIDKGKTKQLTRKHRP